MSTQIVGRHSWSPLNVDAEGHRTYRIKWRIAGDYTDGPANALQTAGLPLVGSIWQFDSDLDLWAWCRYECTVTEEVEGEANKFFYVEQLFSTRPPDGQHSRCNDTPIEDPLLEPYQISGDYVRNTVEATHDRFGHPIINSSHELMKGQQLEFDTSRFTITIKQNVPDLQLGLMNALKDCVNDAPLWGLPARCIKYTPGPWERKFYGQCYIYFTRTLNLEANAVQSKDQSGNLLYDASGNPILESGWDRNLVDEGEKAVNGHWGAESKGEVGGRWYVDNINGEAPDRSNPAHFIRVTDPKGQPMHVILDGTGVPVQLNGDSYNARTVTVDNHGSGYLEDDTITLAGGTFTQAVVLKVTKVLNEPTAGQLAGLMIISNPGSYTAIPPNSVSQGSTSGGGSGATFTVEWSEPDTGTSPGSIHVEKHPEANLLLLGIPLVLGY